jgi:hypothetical protein
MQIVVGANRLSKYWIKFLLFWAALHLSTFSHKIWVTVAHGSWMQCENMYFVQNFVENVAVFV